LPRPRTLATSPLPLPDALPIYFFFDPLLGPDEPPGRTGLNAALGTRLDHALLSLRNGNGTVLQDPEDPPIAVQTQSFVSGVFSPDRKSTRLNSSHVKTSSAVFC